jgi:2-iminobutanoate/2-iminopropanoate deaminase
MVRKGTISRNLKEIERLYSRARATKTQFYFAKLAILELCGWLESAQAGLIQRSLSRCVLEPANRKMVQERIEQTHGFGYGKHFRPLLVQIVGLSRFERIEQEFDSGGSLSRLQSLLAKLKDPRNMAAHTHTHGVLPNVDAPSIVRRDLEDVYSYLRELERLLKRRKF